MNNTIEVEVLYANLSRVTVPIQEVDTLSKSEVLTIVVKDATQEGKRQNIAMCLGFDRYALCWKQDAGQDHIMLFGWDDGDFVWRRLSNPYDIDARREVNIPLGCLHVVFQGQQVSDADWVEALRILDRDIL